MEIGSYRDLRVWQLGGQLAEQVYDVTRIFPKHELYGLAGQMQRAAVSVPSNIAEGHTRESSREYLQHLAIARASLAELDTQVEIARRLHYLSPSQFEQICETTSSLGRQLSALRNALTRKLDASPPTPNP